MPSRSEGWGGLFKVPRSVLMNFREAHRLIRSASRKSIRSLRVFEQTAPPSLREGTPPNLGGDWSTSVTAKPGLHRIHYIQTFTRRHFAAPRPFCLGHVWSVTARISLIPGNARGHRPRLQTPVCAFCKTPHLRGSAYPFSTAGCPTSDNRKIIPITKGIPFMNTLKRIQIISVVLLLMVAGGAARRAGRTCIIRSHTSGAEDHHRPITEWAPLFCPG